MKKYTESLWNRFFNRLPDSEAREAIRMLKQGCSYKDIDFFTLKEAEQQVLHHRQQTKSAIAAYRQWKTGQQVRRFFAILRDREGEALRGHAKNMTSLFLDARRDYSDLSHLLMKSVSNDTDLGPSHQNSGQNTKN